MSPSSKSAPPSSAPRSWPALSSSADAFYRRLDLLNSAALAALTIVIASPLAIRDSSFQLTFVAIGCIAGLAIPWLGATVQPYAIALRGWRDVTRDAGHEPRAAQFRLDVRYALRWIASHSPSRAAAHIQNALAGSLAISFRIAELLALTLILQLGMLPLMAANFHRIALSSPAVNLAAVPLTSIIVPWGFLTLIAGLLWPLLGKLLAAPLALITTLLLHIVAWFAALPHWSYRIPTPPLWLTILFFALAITIATIARLNNALQQTNRRLTLHALSAAFIVTALFVATFPFAPTHASNLLESTILDVGQGDSIFLVSPHGKTMLIDGGGAFRGFPGREDHTGTDPGEEAVSPYLWSRGFKKIDVVALTHAHQDHLGGLTAILENFKVGELWIGREVNSRALAQLEALASQHGTQIKHEIRGQTFEWDGVEGQFLWPEIAATEIAPSAKNNDSLVLRLKFGDRTLLFPGDAEKAVERAMLSENDESTIHADILKVGHHGSKNSTTPDFLSAVNPQIAIISSGEGNPYGHPSPEVLDRLETAGVRTLRTDTNGAIHMLTDGKQIEVSCFVACPAPTAPVAPASRRQFFTQRKQHSNRQMALTPNSPAASATQPPTAPATIKTQSPPDTPDSSYTAPTKTPAPHLAPISPPSPSEKTTAPPSHTPQTPHHDETAARLLPSASPQNKTSQNTPTAAPPRSTNSSPPQRPTVKIALPK